VLFHAAVFFPWSGLCYSAGRDWLPSESSSSANAPTHELGVPPAAVLPILTEHTVLLETSDCNETQVAITG
jgi:hypothetical protein